MGKIDPEILKWCIMYIGNLTPEQLNHLIEERKRELGNLFSEQAILEIIAEEMNISLPTEKRQVSIKLSQLVPGLYNLFLQLKVKAIGEIKTFPRQDGSLGQLVKVKVCDETGEMWLTLWDEQTKYIHVLRPNMRIVLVKAYTVKDCFGQVELQLDKTGHIKILKEEKEDAAL